jgi:hypothetical protein
MFILNFIPDWFFPLLATLSLAVFVVSKFISLPQVQLLRYLSVVVFAGSLFMIGANFNNNYWLAKVKEVEQQLALAQAESAKENTKIVEKIVTRREVVRVQGSDIIKYVDREKVVIDETCKIPQPVIDAHNRAVETNKEQ